MKKRTWIATKVAGILLMASILFFPMDLSHALEQGLPYGVHIRNGKIVSENTFEPSDDFSQVLYVNSYTSMLINYPQGYSIQYPSSMSVDVSLSKVKTVLFNDVNMIEIYYDDFRNTLDTYSSYINYGNKFLEVPGHVLDEKKSIKINGYTTNIIRWHRNKLARVSNDFNYYASAEIKKNNKEVYTVILKSKAPIENFDALIKTFQILDSKKGTPRINKTFHVVHRKLNESTKEFYDRYLGPDSTLQFGIFENSAPGSMKYLNQLEEKLDYQFPVLVRYQTFNEEIPIWELQNAAEQNKVVELTFQAFHKGKDARTLTYDILNGVYDDYFVEYASKLKQFGKPVLFRFHNEMNGDWCPYSSFYTSKDTKLFIDCWRYLYKIFKEQGADNVLWVWNPHDRSFPNFKWNHYLNYYPGDEYVDVVGLTGYNTGNYYPGEYWRSFEEVYDWLYAEYAALFKKPLIITEFACSAIGGDKVAWVRDMFEKFDKYPLIKIAIWWNGIDWDSNGNPARIYRLDTDAQLIETFKNGLHRYKANAGSDKANAELDLEEDKTNVESD